MPTDDEKYLYTVTQMSEYKLHALADMIFKWISDETGADVDNLQIEWLACSRKRFSDAMNQAAIDDDSPAVPCEMMEIAQQIWDVEDKRAEQ